MDALPRTVLLATDNVAKQKRLSWLLEGLELQFVTPAQLPSRPGLREEGRSHRANAVRKATAWSLAFGGTAIASDGGLVVPALGARWRSLHTQRFAGSERSDAERATALLDLVGPLAGQQRRAYWREVVAIAEAGRLLRTFQVRGGEGVIASTFARKDIRDGFWVGALLHFPSVGKPYARLTPEELRRVGDHWAALRSRVRRWATETCRDSERASA